MRQIILLALIMVSLSACGGEQHTATALPTNPTPDATSIPPASILTDFPLSKGATWKYAAEISYQDPNNDTKLVTWTGFITDRVIDEKTTQDGEIVFTMQEDLEPMPSPEVWRQAHTFEYIVSGDEIFKGGLKIYQWPLSDQLSWEAFPDSGYLVIASRVGVVGTPYGELKDCYELLFTTLPDTTVDTFCPGIGLVEHSYQHHGTPQIEHYVLISYTPGQ